MIQTEKLLKISALPSNNLDKYEYLTGEDLGLKPSTVELPKFEYSPLGKVFNNGLKEEDKKEGLLKRLRNIQKNQNNNNNDKSNLSSVRSELSSTRSESNTKTLFSDDDETQTSFNYLKDNTEEFLKSFPNIFDSDLKEFLIILCLKKKRILITACFQDKF